MELCSESSIAAMGMVEEGQSQVTTSSKVIKFQEIVEKGDEDRISNLPENLLLEILSRLPSTKDAIRTGTLSKRWKHLWTLVPTLSFKNNAFNRPLSEFFSFVDKTLTQCRQLKLQKFQVSTSYDIGFESQINNWIRYAISCNVEDLILLLWNTKSKAELLLDQSFFTCSSFTDLRLSGRCMLNPTEVISWKNLRSLCIIFGKLDEVVIENILSGSPVLETLVLKSCYGFIRLDITSKSVKNLVLSGYQKYKGTYDNVIIKINAPDILSLKIEGVLNSWKLLLLNVSSLVKADLEYKLMNKFEQIPKEVKEETLKGIILNLHHVKELKVGVYCAKVVSRLAAKGFVVPSNVKASDVTYQWPDIDSSGSDTAENEDL